MIYTKDLQDSMTDKEYWQCFNPKHWDRDTWAGGVSAIVMLFICYFLIAIFH